MQTDRSSYTAARRMTPPSTRIVMLGTGDFALPTFVHLLRDRPPASSRLITQPDRPQGRKQELIPSRIKRRRRASAGIPVEQPEDVNAPSRSSRSGPRPRPPGDGGLRPDPLGRPAGDPPPGGINLHGSILPATGRRARWRGRSRTASARPGVTVIRMTPRIDAGGMIAVARTPIGPDETAGELEDRLARLGAPLVAEVDRRPRGRHRRDPAPGQGQGHEGPEAPQGRRPDRLVEARPGGPRPGPRHAALADRLHVLAPRARPGRRTAPPDRPPDRAVVEASGPGPGDVLEADGDRLVVAAGQGAVRLLHVQLAGKKPMPSRDFLRGQSRRHRVTGWRGPERGSSLDRDRFGMDRFPSKCQVRLPADPIARLVQSRIVAIADEAAFPDAGLVDPAPDSASGSRDGLSSDV